jgi:citrate synthase
MSELESIRDYWKTSIVDIRPGEYRIRGYPIGQLIGHLTFSQTLWLMLRGDLPSREQAALLEAAMVASVDGGPLSPSCAIASMAATCGVGLNSAVASGLNVLGDTHGGAGQQCMVLLEAIARRIDAGEPPDDATAAELAKLRFAPGFGHRFHPVDPRTQRLLEVVRAARDEGVIAGRYLDIALGVERTLERNKGKHLPMNIDGASAVVFCELGFPPPLGRGLFILSRAVGLLAHAWEQMQTGARIKGPYPPEVGYTYTGEPEHDYVPAQTEPGRA